MENVLVRLHGASLHENIQLTYLMIHLNHSHTWDSPSVTGPRGLHPSDRLDHFD